MSRRAYRAPCARVVQASLLGCLSWATAFAAETGSVCVRDYTAGLDCPANDLRISKLAPVTILEDCGSGDPATAEAVFDVWVETAGLSRYDLGLFLAMDGGSALSGGQCLHDYLEPPLDSNPTYGDHDSDGVADLYNGPWWNAEPFDPSDSCGDIAGGTNAIKTLVAFRFACVDRDGDGIVDISTCTSWSSGTTSKCQGLTEAIPASNSRCGCNVVQTGIPMPGSGRIAALHVDSAGPGQLQLSWGASCVATDTDYEVYEGTLGDFYSHHGVLCTTGGATSITIQAAAEDAYYLVVPRNAQSEGSYGADGAGVERPPAAVACRAQLVGSTCQ